MEITTTKQPLGPLQEEWLRCLESGEWKQGRALLCSETGGNVRYCCLGVACEVAIANGVSLKQRKDGVWRFGGTYTSLPPPVVKTMKFHSYCGAIAETAIDVLGFTDLARANDAGATFKQIAKFVRAHPEAVFTEPA